MFGSLILPRIFFFSPLRVWGDCHSAPSPAVSLVRPFPRTQILVSLLVGTPPQTLRTRQAIFSKQSPDVWLHFRYLFYQPLPLKRSQVTNSLSVDLDCWLVSSLKGGTHEIKFPSNASAGRPEQQAGIEPCSPLLFPF